MPIGNVVVNVVDVGQGQCTFVEIYDQSSPATLLYTLLFDCGTNKESDETTANLKYIASKALENKPAGFDAIFFSHSDSDHINKTYELLELIDDVKKPTIGKVFFAGDRALYTKNKFNILDYIEQQKYCGAANIKALPSNSTGFDQKTDTFTWPLWTTSDKTFKVLPIVANVLSEDPDWYDNDEDVSGKTAEQKNRISLICMLSYQSQSYVICGDATNTTMCAVNFLFDKGTTQFDNNKMTTLPHHGSRATAFAVPRGKTPDPEAIKTVKTFANLLKSRFLTDSAFQKHRHPSLELMSLFIPVRKEPLIQDARLKEKDAHMATAYFDFDVSLAAGFNFDISWLAQQSFETKTNTFTTRYYDGWPTCYYDLGTGNKASESKGAKPGKVIDGFASWVFTTKADKTMTLMGVPHLGGDIFTEGAGTFLREFGEEPSPAEPKMMPANEALGPPPPVFAILPRTPHPPAVRQSQFHNRIQRFR